MAIGCKAACSRGTMFSLTCYVSLAKQD